MPLFGTVGALPHPPHETKWHVRCFPINFPDSDAIHSIDSNSAAPPFVMQYADGGSCPCVRCPCPLSLPIPFPSIIFIDRITDFIRWINEAANAIFCAYNCINNNNNNNGGDWGCTATCSRGIWFISRQSREADLMQFPPFRTRIPYVMVALGRAFAVWLFCSVGDVSPYHHLSECI